MPKQKVTIEVDVPEGYEATGRVMTYGKTMHASEDEYLATRLYLRKLPDPVEEWLARHPWLPEGRWVYRWHNKWFISISRPAPLQSDADNGFGATGSVADLGGVASVLGHTFTPPPVDCLQVKRTPTPPAKEEASDE